MNESNNNFVSWCECNEAEVETNETWGKVKQSFYFLVEHILKYVSLKNKLFYFAPCFIRLHFPLQQVTIRNRKINPNPFWVRLRLWRVEFFSKMEAFFLF
jgi:hypothetical protein